MEAERGGRIDGRWHPDCLLVHQTNPTNYRAEVVRSSQSTTAKVARRSSSL